MDISTVKTIVSIIPTEKPNEREYVPKTFIPHIVTEERLSQEYQLKMTGISSILAFLFNNLMTTSFL